MGQSPSHCLRLQREGRSGSSLRWSRLCCVVVSRRVAPKCAIDGEECRLALSSRDRRRLICFRRRLVCRSQSLFVRWESLRSYSALLARGGKWRSRVHSLLSQDECRFPNFLGRPGPGQNLKNLVKMHLKKGGNAKGVDLSKSPEAAAPSTPEKKVREDGHVGRGQNFWVWVVHVRASQGGRVERGDQGGKQAWMGARASRWPCLDPGNVQCASPRLILSPITPSLAPSTSPSFAAGDELRQQLESTKSFLSRTLCLCLSAAHSLNYSRLLTRGFFN